MTDIQTLDLEFLGASQVIASFLKPVDGGFVLFDTGPASCVDVLAQKVEEQGFKIEDLKAVFATHVHLDHSGAAGVLSQRTGCDVFVHPAGVEHIAHPEHKLLPSAERIYGDRMESLWGKIVGVPEERVCDVSDGEKVAIGDTEIQGWLTPGHANHHVAWQIGDWVATGDVAGVRFPGATHVLPPMPPPDIDVEAWIRSIELVRGLEPETLLLTHYGAFHDPQRHLDELEARLRSWTKMAEIVISTGGDWEDVGLELAVVDAREMEEAGVPEEAVVRYRQLCPMKENSAGLFRYCSKKAANNP